MKSLADCFSLEGFTLRFLINIFVRKLWTYLTKSLETKLVVRKKKCLAANLRSRLLEKDVESDTCLEYGYYLNCFHRKMIFGIVERHDSF